MGPLVLALVITGNKAIPTAELERVVAGIKCDARHALEMGVSRAIVGEDAPACGSLEDKALTLEVFYQDHGFIQASVDVVGETIRVKEGARFRFGKIELADPGLDGLAAPARRLVTLKTGATFDVLAVRERMEVVRKFYERAGFPHANVLPLAHVDLDTHVIDIRVEITRD